MKRVDFWRETLARLSREQRTLLVNSMAVALIIDITSRSVEDHKLQGKLLNCIIKVYDEWWEQELDKEG